MACDELIGRFRVCLALRGLSMTAPQEMVAGIACAWPGPHRVDELRSEVGRLYGMPVSRSTAYRTLALLHEFRLLVPSEGPSA